VIECLPFSAFVGRYDSPTTLFYLDPPHFGSEADYGGGVFSRANFVCMAIRLSAIAGRFILSVNDVPETRAAFACFAIQGVANHREPRTDDQTAESRHTGPTRVRCGNCDRRTSTLSVT
jgi:site-specific DNA-adenine methylase